MQPDFGSRGVKRPPSALLLRSSPRKKKPMAHAGFSIHCCLLPLRCRYAAPPGLISLHFLPSQACPLRPALTAATRKSPSQRVFGVGAALRLARRFARGRRDGCSPHVVVLVESETAVCVRSAEHKLSQSPRQPSHDRNAAAGGGGPCRDAHGLGH